MNQACLVSSYHFPELSLVSLSLLSMGLHELTRLVYQSPKTVNNTRDLVSKAKEAENTKLTYYNILQYFSFAFILIMS